MALEQNVQSIELVIKVVSLVDIKTPKKDPLPVPWQAVPARPHHPRTLNESGGRAEGRRARNGHQWSTGREGAVEKESPSVGISQPAPRAGGDAPSPPLAPRGYRGL